MKEKSGSGKNKSELDAEYNRQMRGFINKQKSLIKSLHNEYEKAQAIGLWAGFLTGMKITNLIQKEEYDLYYEEVKNFCEKL